jgi:hypothetical protein
VIKVHGNPEPYWIQFMRSWLNSLQTELDKATAAGLIPTDDTSKLAKEATLKNYTINDEFLIARQLLCSSGKQFDCSNKVILNIRL